MASALSQNNKIAPSQPKENSIEILIARLYRLKEKFESRYYGKKTIKKYDKARDFTIRLNATLYQANQLQAEEHLPKRNLPLSNKHKASIYLKKYAAVSDSDPEQLKAKIKELDQELRDLIR